MVALYEPRACLVLERGAPARGTAAIRKAIAMFAAMKPKFQMNVGKIVKAGDDLAVLYNDWTLSATGPTARLSRTRAEPPRSSAASATGRGASSSTTRARAAETATARRAPTFGP